MPLTLAIEPLTIFIYLHPLIKMNKSLHRCLDGGIGRRAGLKNLWGYTRAGSIPARGTAKMPFQSWEGIFIWSGLILNLSFNNEYRTRNIEKRSKEVVLDSLHLSLFLVHYSILFWIFWTDLKYYFFSQKGKFRFIIIQKSLA